MIISILAVVLVFGAIVLVHEWGHMMAAKACGVAVPDFAIGMGPSLFSFRLGDTRYHVCAFPIGGFVRIAGMEGDDALPRTRGELERMSRDITELPEHAAEVQRDPAAAQDPEYLAEQISEHAVDETANPTHRITGRWRTWRDLNGWQKTFVLVGGPAMNFILAFAIIIAMGFVGFPENAVLIADVTPDSPALAAGLAAGDLVTHADGRRVTSSPQFSAIVAAHRDEPLALTVRRGEEQLQLSAQPAVIDGYNSGQVSLGVALSEASAFTNEINLIQPKSRADDAFVTAEGERIKLAVGDKIVAMNGQPVTDGLQVLMALAQFDDSGAVTEPLDAALPLTIQRRDGSRHTITLPPDTSMISLGVMFRQQLTQLPPGQALRRSLEDSQTYMLSMFYNIKLLFSSADVAKSISGPVGIMRMIGQSAQSDLHTFLFMFMLINLNLGLINLLPLPALDGGRLVFVALSGIGVRVHEKREAMVHAMGMVMLLGLILLITVGDIGAMFG